MSKKKNKKMNPAQLEAVRTKDFFDCILPGSVRFMSDYYIVGDSYRSVWVVREYPPSTEEQAILSQLADRSGVTLRIYHRLVEPMEQRKILQNATRKNKLMSGGNDVNETMGDMAQYLGDDPGVADKLMSAVWTVEDIDGRLLGRIDCHLKEPLTPDEMADLREEILGQCSDGLGEGFEQRPIETDEGDLYVSYWNSSDDYFLCTEDELEEHLEPHQGMGGI